MGGVEPAAEVRAVGTPKAEETTELVEVPAGRPLSLSPDKPQSETIFYLSGAFAEVL
jgi:hypothetical protein